MIIASSKDSQVANYNVARDGGAIGVYPLGLYVDEFSFITNISWGVLQDFTASGGIATVTLWAMVGNVIQYPLIGETTDIMLYLTTRANTDPSMIQQAVQIAAVVTDFPLLTGQLNVYIEYFNTDI